MSSQAAALWAIPALVLGAWIGLLVGTVTERSASRRIVAHCIAGRVAVDRGAFYEYTGRACAATEEIVRGTYAIDRPAPARSPAAQLPESDQ